MSSIRIVPNRVLWVLSVAAVLVALVLAAYFVSRGRNAPSLLQANSNNGPAISRGSSAPINHPFPEDRDHHGAQIQTSTTNWVTKFRSADDYLKFVREALPAARSGDGRAAWYIGQALSSCAYVIKTYQGVRDPEAQLNQQLTGMTKAPQWTKDQLEQKTKRCLGLAQEDPFASLPHRDGGYASSYWNEQALADAEPLAQDAAAAAAMATLSVMRDMSADAKAEKLRAIDTNVRAAVESGDADALFGAGELLADGRYSSNPLNALAVSLAACDLGHDCSADNPENAFANCKFSGACPPDANFAYFLQQSLGAENYAKVYARAQEVKQLIEAGDWDAVLANLKVDKPQ
jgi:hypothetical protein